MTVRERLGVVMMSGSWIRVAGSGLVAAVGVLALVVSGNAEATTLSGKGPGVGSSNAIACGLSYPDKDASGWVSFPAGTTTLRSGPSNSCLQTGQGLHDQRAQYFCYLPGDGGTWTLLRNTSTGDQGWVRDDLLPGNGSDVPCDQNPPPASVTGN